MQANVEFHEVLGVSYVAKLQVRQVYAELFRIFGVFFGSRQGLPGMIKICMDIKEVKGSPKLICILM